MIKPRQQNDLFISLDDLPLTVTSLKELEDPLHYAPKVTIQGFTKEITSAYTCMICQEVYNNPVRTTCQCETIICNDCFIKNRSKCPICRKQTNAAPNEHIKKILAKQEIVCKCGTKYKYGYKSEHEAVCKNSSFTCYACIKTMNGPQTLEHLLDNHYLQVILSFGKIVSS